MIFITVGTQKFQFNRLLKKIDLMKKNGLIKDEVFAQIGYSTYIPESYNYKDFLDKDEFIKLMNESNIIITHSGVGTIIKGINLNKPVIVVPRLKKYREHVDDHQLEIATSFSKKNFVLNTEGDINKLDVLIPKCLKFKFNKYYSSNDNIQKTIIDFIEEK